MGSSMYRITGGGSGAERFNRDAGKYEPVDIDESLSQAIKRTQEIVAASSKAIADRGGNRAASEGADLGAVDVPDLDNGEG